MEEIELRPDNLYRPPIPSYLELLGVCLQVRADMGIRLENNIRNLQTDDKSGGMKEKQEPKWGC